VGLRIQIKYEAKNKILRIKFIAKLILHKKKSDTTHAMKINR